MWFSSIKKRWRFRFPDWKISKWFLFLADSLHRQRPQSSLGRALQRRRLPSGVDKKSFLRGLILYLWIRLGACPTVATTRVGSRRQCWKPFFFFSRKWFYSFTFSWMLRQTWSVIFPKEAKPSRATVATLDFPTKKFTRAEESTLDLFFIH